MPARPAPPKARDNPSAALFSRLKAADPYACARAFDVAMQRACSRCGARGWSPLRLPDEGNREGCGRCAFVTPAGADDPRPVLVPTGGHAAGLHDAIALAPLPAFAPWDGAVHAFPSGTLGVARWRADYWEGVDADAD